MARKSAMRFNIRSAFIVPVLLLFILTYLPVAGAQPDLPFKYRVDVSIEVDDEGTATLHVSSEWMDSCHPVYAAHLVDRRTPKIIVFTYVPTREGCAAEDYWPWSFSVALGALPAGEEIYTVTFDGAFEYSTIVFAATNKHLVNLPLLQRPLRPFLRNSAIHPANCRIGGPIWSPDGTRIAFTYAEDQHSRKIYVVNADNDSRSVATALTAGFSPAWSPDSTRIAFTTYRDNNAEIYVMNADGSDQTRLTRDRNEDFNPTWSPDGSTIVFVSDRVESDNEVYVMNADGSGQTRLTRSRRSESPTWSPSGTKIAFVSESARFNLLLMNPDGTNQVALTDSRSDAWSPAWSPDGKRIAFQRSQEDSDIYVVDVDGGNLTDLSKASASDASPSWSPDGTKIAFLRWDDATTGWGWRLYVMNSDGSNQIALSDYQVYEYQTPTWSPDGSKIAFTQNCHIRVVDVPNICPMR